MIRPLNIFFPHCSELLTDHQSHGDGLVAYGFISHLAERGHSLYVAAEAVDLRRVLPGNVHITEIRTKTKERVLDRMRYMARVRALYHEVNRNVGIDLIHQLNPVFTGLSLAVAGARAPVVLGPYVGSWPRDPDAAAANVWAPDGLVRFAKRTVARLQQSQAAALLLTTPAARSRVPAVLGSGHKIHMLPHGLDTKLFSPGEGEEATPKEGQDILFLASLTERKGLFDLLKAFNLMASDLPKARLLIAGVGPELGRANEMTQSFAAADRIIFLGHQTREQSVALLRQCAVFCQPSHGEPFGMSAAEAMSCAKPLVVTDAGGLRYLVDDEGGLRVGVGCPEELSRALTDLLSNPAKRLLMGEHNRRRVISSMSWDKVVDQLETVYERAIR